jgi:hypothetical protein
MKTILDIAENIQDRGFGIAGVTVHTQDNRAWSIECAGTGGFRLFEIDDDQGTRQEHDAVDDETWSAQELVDYLDAVGRPR